MLLSACCPLCCVAALLGCRGESALEQVKLQLLELFCLLKASDKLRALSTDEPLSF